MIVTCGPCPESLKQSVQVKEILQQYGPLSFSAFAHIFVDSLGENQPEPFAFSYRTTVCEALPLISGEELEMLLDFLKCMLQIDPDGRLTPSELLRHPWLSVKDESKDTTDNN
jgi:serine/threonine protein kinase